MHVRGLQMEVLFKQDDSVRDRRTCECHVMGMVMVPGQPKVAAIADLMGF